MNPKMGRPKAENPKNIDIKIRVDSTTNEKLINYAVDHQITRVEAIRKGIELLLDKKK